MLFYTMTHTRRIPFCTLFPFLKANFCPGRCLPAAKPRCPLSQPSTPDVFGRRGGRLRVLRKTVLGAIGGVN